MFDTSLAVGEVFLIWKFPHYGCEWIIVKSAIFLEWNSKKIGTIFKLSNEYGISVLDGQLRSILHCQKLIFHIIVKKTSDIVEIYRTVRHHCSYLEHQNCVSMVLSGPSVCMHSARYRNYCKFGIFCAKLYLIPNRKSQGVTILKTSLVTEDQLLDMWMFTSRKF